MRLGLLLVLMMAVSGSAMGATYECEGPDEDTGELVKFKVTKDEQVRMLRAEAPAVGQFVEGVYSTQGNLTNGYRRNEVIGWQIAIVLTESENGVTAELDISDYVDVELATCRMK